MNKILDFLATVRTQLILLTFLAATLAMGDFYPEVESFQKVVIGILLFLLAMHVILTVIRQWKWEPNCFLFRLVHFGFLTILLGWVIGGVFGTREFLTLRQGEEKEILGFSVRLKDFVIERHQEENGAIKDLKSFLEVKEHGQVKKRDLVKVNHPLRYKDYTFYQMDYDSWDETASGIQVVKDPGIAIVYAGFAFFFVGLVCNLRVVFKLHLLASL